MAQKIGVLTALAVNRLTKAGYYADGGGLYLQVSPGGAKTWIFRYSAGGRRPEMGLGPLHTVSLSEAREAALACRKAVRSGQDPIRSRNDERDRAATEAAGRITFDACADMYIEAHKAGWRNEKHTSQWTNTIRAYVSPVCGTATVDQVGLLEIMKVLEAIWQKKPETASRLRSRIEAVLDWATVKGYRKGENPARWRGHPRMIPRPKSYCRD